jgi:hypothetical protein
MNRGIRAPFALSHHPARSPGHYVLAGHLHPALRIEAGGDRLRLPCFAFGPAVGLLPAFGAFTGQMNIAPDPDMRCFVATPDRYSKCRTPQHAAAARHKMRGRPLGHRWPDETGSRMQSSQKALNTTALPALYGAEALRRIEQHYAPRSSPRLMERAGATGAAKAMEIWAVATAACW